MDWRPVSLPRMLSITLNTDSSPPDSLSHIQVCQMYSNAERKCKMCKIYAAEGVF